jgi:GAF domain-containing protein
VRRYEAMFQRRGDEMLAAIERGVEDVHDDMPLLRIAGAAAEARADQHAADGRTAASAPRMGVASPVDGAPERPGMAREVAPSTAAFEILAEITRGILAQEDINDTLAMVLEGIARTGRFDVAFLALLNARKDRLVGRLGYGDGVAEYLRALSIPLAPGAGMLADAVLAREPRVVPRGTPAMLVPNGSPVPTIPAASFVVQPLVVRTKVVGVMVAARRGGPVVGATDLTLVQVFCNQAGLALDRAVA